MKIESDAVIPFDRETVYRAYRDNIQDFIQFLPNVEEVREDERVDEGKIIKLVNTWRAGGDIPTAIRKFVENKMTWHDYATWKQDEWTCSWRIETDVFTDAVRCWGENRFVDLGDRTRVEITGALGIDLTKVKGVPSIVAGSLSRSIERFITRQLTTNLTSVSDGVSQYLAQRTQPDLRV